MVVNQTQFNQVTAEALRNLYLMYVVPSDQTVDVTVRDNLAALDAYAYSDVYAAMVAQGEIPDPPMVSRED